MEKLGRAKTARVTMPDSTGLLTPDFENRDFGHSISTFMCALDAVRAGETANTLAEIPADPVERSKHLKSAGYFLDASVVGISRLSADHLLDQPHVHPLLDRLSFEASEEKLRLRFNPHAVIKQIEQAKYQAGLPISNHTHMIVIANGYSREPDAAEPGCEWIHGLQPWRAAVRAAETGVAIASYLRILGFDARSHSATTSNINLHRAAMSAGLATTRGDGVTNPFIGDRFELSVVTTLLELEPDNPLRTQTGLDRMRAKGPGWWAGWSSQNNPRNMIEMTGRPYRYSRFPTEKLKRVEKPTSFIDEDRVPRVPKSSEMFLRAAFGDLGKPAMEASKDGFAVTKAPLAGALRSALNVYSLLQRGEPAKEQVAGFTDTTANADTIKAAMHFLGADLAGVSRAPSWVWYSHKQDGSVMEVAHPNAVSVMIDQGYETMAGASGDDWISSAQSMRTYMRAALVCGVVGQHIRNLGFAATCHSAADSDVIQTPLVLLAGLGEISRIGDTILNPFLGPRLKTGILTTDFPMTPDLPIDFGLQNFCNSCNKCARECPSGSITAGKKVMFNGYEIWKADSGKCTQYRTTNLGGAMCGRCMKTCPWNLEGLVVEEPFRWVAMRIPKAAKWIAKLDDMFKRGTINPAKKWWWDVARNKSGYIVAAENTHKRELNTQIKLEREDQTLAMYPIDLAPPPLPMPSPLDREAGIKAYETAISPKQYQVKLASGQTEGLVAAPKQLSKTPPVIVAKIATRSTSSSDGKIDLFEIVAQDGSDLPAFTAGAHIDVTVSPQFIRQFSLAGDPTDRTKYLFGVLREEPGRGGSRKIHQLLKPGAAVVVSQPRNHFPIAETSGKYLLLAGGIGITPLIAMGHSLARANAVFQLYYKARTRAQAAFIPELEAVSWRDRVHFHFSDENRLDIATVLKSYTSGDHVYTCGPAAFMDAVFDSAQKHGWPEDAMHREYFSVPEDDDWVNQPFEVELASSGKSIPVPADKPITEALADIGVIVDTKCSDGLCGVCATRYLKGDIEHRDYVLSKAQKSEQIILCCSRAAKKNGRIVLDL